MRTVRAAAGSLAHFVLQPALVAGLVPWWLTGWRVRPPAPSWAWAPLRLAGLVLLAAGAVVLVHAFVRLWWRAWAAPRSGRCAATFAVSQ